MREVATGRDHIQVAVTQIHDGGFRLGEREDGILGTPDDQRWNGQGGQLCEQYLPLALRANDATQLSQRGC